MNRLIVYVFTGFAVWNSVGIVVAEEPDWQAWDSLLKEVVVPGVKNGISLNRVDYQKLRNDERFLRTIQSLSTFPVERLSTRKEKLAFYINTYNILAIKVVLDHWPLQSIRDVGNWISPVWKKDAGHIAGRTINLHEVEHEILRPMGDPRIHMAIVCASVSCPDLRPEAYTASRLDQQLDDQSRTFLNNNGKGLQLRGKVVTVSKIFDWFEDDFEKSGGLAHFLRQYRPGLPASFSIEAELNYDWYLNSF